MLSAGTVWGGGILWTGRYSSVVEFLHPMCETLAYTTSGPGLGGVGKEQFFKMSEPVRLSQLQVLGAGA